MSVHQIHTPRNLNELWQGYAEMRRKMRDDVHLSADAEFERRCADAHRQWADAFRKWVRG